MKRKVVIERPVPKRSPDDVIGGQLDYIVGRALAGSRGKCWEHHCTWAELEPKTDRCYRAAIHLEKVRGQLSEDVAQRQYEEIMRFLQRACRSSKMGKYPWIIKEAPGIDLAALDEQLDEEAPPSEMKDYDTVTVPKGEAMEEAAARHLSHIYDRDAQIRVIVDNLEAFVASDFQHRFHTVLHGPPGCGKSEILSGIGNMLGAEGEAYLKVDATSTTQAGISKLLLEARTIPPVLIIEEIEKTDEKSLRYLLGILDQRAEIRRLNARVGAQAREVKLLCLATANDMVLFGKLMAGALASRFSIEVPCPRPSRDVLKLILEREVATVGGKLEWVEPALDLAQTLQLTDPRKVIPLCLGGRDRLLDNSFQADLMKFHRMKQGAK